jgi:putative oxidoreductase
MSSEKQKRSLSRWRLLEFLLKSALGLLFVLAGATKAWDPAEFAREISRFQLVPWTLAVWIAIYLPWLEMLSGMLLLFRRFERGSLLIITFLLGVFTLALGSALIRGINIDCGCFGQALVSTGVLFPLIRNMVLLLCSGALWIARRKSEKLGT